MAKIGSIKEAQNVVEAVKKADLTYLKTIVPETLLELDQALNYRFVIDPTFLQMLKEINDGLDFQTKHIDALDKKLNNTSASTGMPLGLNVQIADYQKLIDDPATGLKKKISDLQAEIDAKNSDLKSANKDDVIKAKNAVESRKSQMDAKKREIDALDSKIKVIQEEANKIKERKDALEDFWTTYQSIIGKSDKQGTRKRLKDIIDIGDKFVSNNLIPRQTHKLGDTSAGNKPIPLGPLFVKGGLKYPIGYTLCDNQQGNPLVVEGGGVDVSLDGGQTVKLTGVKIVGDELKIEKIQIDPTTGLTFPVNFRIAVRARVQDPVTGVNLDHFKNLDFTINESNFDKPLRAKEIKKYNNTGAGAVIKNSIDANHENNIEAIEKDMFFKAVAKGDGPKLDKLSDKQKDDLFKTTRAMYRAKSTAPIRAKQLENMNDFDSGKDDFLQWMSADDHESNKPEFTKDAKTYRDYIHNNLEDQIKKYFEYRFTKVFEKDKDASTFLKAQVTNYLTEIEKQKKDTDVHKDLAAVLRGDDFKMKNARRFKLFGRKDVNYLTIL